MRNETNALGKNSLLRHTCMLCGHRFSRFTASCASCAFQRGACDVVACPNCGHQFPVESQIWNFFTRLLRPFFKKPKTTKTPDSHAN